MGVEGLTTYLRENRLAVARTVELRRRSSRANEQTSGEQNIEIVVDGWSFIYCLYHTSHIPWVYGGEYDRFANSIRRVIEMWLSMGVNLSFVFDGPYESHKIGTRLARQTNTVVHHGALFFRTSHATRITPRFLAETRIIPPLVYAACTETLKDMATIFKEGATNGPHAGRIDIYYADREADPFIVELAGRLHAYIAALDSDFVIFSMPGYKGYIPLDELEWVIEGPPEMLLRSRTVSLSSTTSSFAPSELSASTNASIWNDLVAQGGGDTNSEEGGFVPVIRKKGKSAGIKTALLQARAKASTAKTIQRGLVPPLPDNGEIASLNFTAYTPESTALALGIAPSLLPLLGAIVGNDATHSAKYSIPGATTLRTPISSARPTATHHDFLFERKMNAPQRVIYTANTLASVLRKSGKNGKINKSILEVIRSVVTMMLLRPRDTTDREIDEIVNRIVEGALVYAINPSTVVEQSNRDSLWPTAFCALHSDLEQCRLEALVPEGDESESDEEVGEEARTRVQTEYLHWYREGSLDANILDVLVTGTFWPRMFLESPDYASTSGSIEAAGALRRWVYAILEQGIGVYVPPPPEEDEEEVVQEGSEGNSTSSSRAQKEEEEGSEEDDDDDDEVVDVVDEESSEEGEPIEDPLMALKGALQRLRGTGASAAKGGHLPTIPDQEDNESEEEDEHEHGRCAVTEYIRRGARIAEERVMVEDLNSMLIEASKDNKSSVRLPIWKTSKIYPIQLEKEDMRFAVLLLACQSNTSRVRALDHDWLLPVLSIRWLIHFGAQKGKEKTLDSSGLPLLLRPWSRAETVAFLCAFRDPLDSEEVIEDPVYQPSTAAQSVMDRSVQVMARALSVMEAVRMLVQVLGLSNRVPLRISNFRASVFHALCQQESASAERRDLEPGLLEAVEDGLEGCFARERVRKEKKRNGKTGTGKSSAQIKQLTGKGGMFSLLAQLDG